MPVSLLCTGGARSGKSAFALRWAEAQAQQRVFIATARVQDAETALRVRDHQAERGAGWVTLEEPLDICSAVQRGVGMGGVLVVDCLTMWVSNCMAAEQSDADIRQHSENTAVFLRTAPVPSVVVTSELGMGMVPMHALGRRFRDLHGVVNQIFSAACSDVCLLVSGLPLIVKGTSLQEALCTNIVCP